MTRALLATLLALSFGCRATAPLDKDEAFLSAVDNQQKDRHVRAVNAAWAFIEASDPDDPRYDRAMRLTGLSLEQLGFTFGASMLYRQIAQDRRNIELVPDAILGIARVVDTQAYDDDTLLTSFVATEEFGFLPEEARAFVDYYQGLDLARRGIDDWAQERFSQLPEGSEYAHRARYVSAVRHIADGSYEPALEILEEILEDEEIRDELRNEVRRSVARIAFEQERFEDALVQYEELRTEATDDPDILLESAWTTYYLGDSRKTLGLLIALDAPIHRGFISPERYLLEALALRRLCQFGAAREAAVRLERRFGASLAALAGGTMPEDIAEIRSAARQRGFARGNGRFGDRLEAERDLLRHVRLDERLETYLAELYGRGAVEVERREAEQLDREVAALTEELLAAQEGVRLIVHELGVSMLRGRRRPTGAREKAAVEIPLTGELIFFPFQGEYWTDEMNDLVVVAEDRCIE